MTTRWLILFVRFSARMTMGFQFQSIPALSPFLAESYAVDLAEIGFLIGLYLALESSSPFQVARSRRGSGTSGWWPSASA